MKEIKQGAYIINLDEYKSIGTHWIALYVNGDNVTHFRGLRIEYIPKEFLKNLGNKNIATKIYRIQASNSIICGYFSIGFIDFTQNVKFR